MANILNMGGDLPAGSLNLIKGRVYTLCLEIGGVVLVYFFKSSHGLSCWGNGVKRGGVHLVSQVEKERKRKGVVRMGGEGKQVSEMHLIWE